MIYDSWSYSALPARCPNGFDFSGRHLSRNGQAWRYERNFYGAIDYAARKRRNKAQKAARRRNR